MYFRPHNRWPNGCSFFSPSKEQCCGHPLCLVIADDTDPATMNRSEQPFCAIGRFKEERLQIAIHCGRLSCKGFLLWPGIAFSNRSAASKTNSSSKCRTNPLGPMAFKDCLIHCNMDSPTPEPDERCTDPKTGKSILKGEGGEGKNTINGSVTVLAPYFFFDAQEEQLNCRMAFKVARSVHGERQKERVCK